MQMCPAPFYQALAAGDAGADGVFFYAVKTTGIYCLPSCPAKAPRLENTECFPTARAAEAAGYRACKRCRPDQAGGETGPAGLVAAACRRIEAAETAPSLGELAAAAKLSPSHFHRLFTSVTGVTPKDYAAVRRERHMREILAGAASVTEAVYDAGYSAPSRFYEAAAGLGMAPKMFRAGAPGQTIRFAVAPCRLGLVLAAHHEGKICAIFLGDDAAALRGDLAKAFFRAALAPAEADFADTLAAVVALVDEPGRARDLPLDIAGTAFQRRVWQALRAVPPGATVTYAELAARIGAPKAVRTVASACAANKLAVAIPCHRAVRADGGMAGYRWGVARKRRLLAAERDDR